MLCWLRAARHASLHVSVGPVQGAGLTPGKAGAGGGGDEEEQAIEEMDEEEEDNPEDDDYYQVCCTASCTMHADCRVPVQSARGSRPERIALPGAMPTVGRHGGRRRGLP